MVFESLTNSVVNDNDTGSRHQRRQTQEERLQHHKEKSEMTAKIRAYHDILLQGSKDMAVKYKRVVFLVLQRRCLLINKKKE